VSGLDGPRRGLGEQGREQQEVLRRDEQDARASGPASRGQQVLEVAGDGGAAEATTDDEDVELFQARQAKGNSPGPGT